MKTSPICPSPALIDMPLSLTSTELQQLTDQAQQQGEPICQPLDQEILSRLPRQLGEGVDHALQLRHGLSVLVRSGTLHQTTQFEICHEVDMPLVSKFYLSGHSTVLTPNVPEIKSSYREGTGQHYLYCLPDLIEYEEWPGQEPIRVVYVLLNRDCLESFLPNRSGLPISLRRLLAGGDRFHQPMGSVTATMERALQQLLSCPYRGALRQMYLEAKALELLALQFDQWGTAQVKPEPRLRPDDIDRLHQARAILLEQLDTPPSLLTLARQVGLNDCKLKQGFRQVFGTTVFGYLQQLRLEKSRQLLEMDQLSVTEVAYAVGYSSLPSFSKAFRKRYGSSPSQYAATFRGPNATLS